jgi:hypothetical protein
MSHNAAIFHRPGLRKIVSPPDIVAGQSSWFTLAAGRRPSIRSKRCAAIDTGFRLK